jgi:hypothetical protein
MPLADAEEKQMRALWAVFGGQVSDLLLVGSLITAPPAWVGSIEILSALGLNGALAALVSGLYVWGRIALSGAVLVRRAHRGDLSFGMGWLFSEPRPGFASPAPTDGLVGSHSIAAVAPTTAFGPTGPTSDDD